MNLFENFDEIVNEEFVEKFKSHNSDNLGDLSLAIKGISYTLLAGLIRKTSSDMSSGMLYNQLLENYRKINVPENLASIFSQDQVLAKINSDGSKIISQIFPAYKSPLLSMISSYAGTSKASTTTASGIVAVVLVKILGKEIETNKLDKDSLVVLLRKHHEELLSRIPENLLEKMIPSLGLHELMNMRPLSAKKSEPTTISETTTEDSGDGYTNEGGSLINPKILVFVVILLAIAGGAYYYYTQNGNFDFFKKSEVPVQTLEIEADSSVSDSTGKALATEEPGVSSEFDTFKEYVYNMAEAPGKEFDFKSIKFIADSTGVSPETQPVVANIAQLMGENAKLQIKITAFSGSGDTPFNNKRAFAIKRLLTAKGINGIRIDAVSGGVGEDSPRIKVITK